VDTGFIVFNRQSYPNLVALFDHLDVPVVPSTMSFGFSADGGRFEYGTDTAAGFFAQPTNLLRPGHWRMLADILRFQREAPRALDSSEISLGELLSAGGYGRAFVAHHMLPMAGAIWSCAPREVLDFPAATFVRFCINHGLLQMRGRPQWWTVEGGSRSYVDRLLARLRGAVRLAVAVTRVRRTPDGVRIRSADGQERRFDQVVFATHPDETLKLLADSTAEERSVLGAFRYRANAAVLHDDEASMPRRRRVWSSWNAIADREGGVSVTYWMNRLQGIRTDAPLFVSLNPLSLPRPEAVYGTFAYDHPVFDRAAIAAQGRIASIQGRDRTWFCGAWCGYGFHEDGLASGVAVAEALAGRPRPWRIEGEMSNAFTNASPGPAERVAAIAAE
jgi:predicted NAD/FAD-binding protein